MQSNEQIKNNLPTLKNNAVQLFELLKTKKQFLVSTMPKHMKESIDSIISTAHSLVRNDPNLLQCNPVDLLECISNGMSLGLRVDGFTGEGYIVKFKAKPQFLPGYKGLIKLAYNSGKVKSIQAKVIYENDFYEIEEGIEEKFIHKPLLIGDRGKPIIYYAILKKENCDPVIEWLNIIDIENHAKKYSKAGNSKFSPWVTAFDEMAKKTVIRKILKYCDLSPEINKYIGISEIVETGNKIPNEYNPETDDFSDLEEIVIDCETEAVENQTEQLKSKTKNLI